MNEWKNLYSALKSLKMYAQSTVLSRELKLKQNRWARENGPAGNPWYQSSEYLWRNLRWKRLEEEVCFKSRVKKRRSDWWWQRWRWQCGCNVCRVARRWKTRMWMRLMERMREWTMTKADRKWLEAFKICIWKRLLKISIKKIQLITIGNENTDGYDMCL